MVVATVRSSAPSTAHQLPMLSSIGVRFASQPRATVAKKASSIQPASLPVPSQNAPRPGRWSLVAGRWSLVAGRWSLVAGRPLRHVAEAGGFLTQTGKRIPLDLADPLTTQLEFVCYLFQGPGSPVVQSEPE